MHVFSAQKNPHFLVVDFQITHMIGTVEGNLAAFRRGAGMAQGCADAGEQFDRPKGLCDVIVGPVIQGSCLVLFHAARRNHNDRCLGPGTHAAYDFPAVHVGKPQVQENAVRAVGGDHLKGSFTVSCDNRGIACCADGGFQKIGNTGIVFNNQNFLLEVCRHGVPPWWEG